LPLVGFLSKSAKYSPVIDKPYAVVPKICIMAVEFQTTEEILKELGTRLRAMRIHRNLEQTEAAARAGVALRTLRALELGQGSTTETLVRVLKALGALDGLEALAPTPTISPLALLRLPHPRQRVRNSKNGLNRMD